MKELNEDILHIISSFINNINDIRSIKNINRYTYSIIYKINFPTIRCVEGIITPIINTYSNIHTLFHKEYIIKLTLNTKKRLFIPPLPNLKYLKCNYIYTNSIKNFTNLETLICRNQNHLRDSSLMSIKKLTYLDCYSSKFTDELLKNLVNLKFLRVCWNNKFTIDGYKNLKKIEYLKTYGLHTVDLFDTLPTLKELICDNNFRDDNIKNKINLEILISNNAIFTDISISSLINIKILSIIEQKMVTDDSIKLLIHLEELHCSESLTGRGLIQLQSLKSLYIWNNKLIDDNIIKNLDLRVLECINNNLITDISVKTQNKLTHLISNTILTDNSLLSLTELEYIDCVINNNFTKKGLLTSKKLKTIKLIPKYINDIRSNKFFNMIYKIKKTIT